MALETILVMLNTTLPVQEPFNGAIPFKSGEKIAFLGDSITDHGFKNKTGYVNLVMEGLKTQVPELEVIPAGVSGNTCRDMIKRLDKDVIEKNPDWMFLSCGVNDAPNGMDNPGVPLEEYKTTISEIVDKCEAAKIKVIVLTATPVVEEEHVANTNLVQYNAFLRTMSKERSLPIIDLNQRCNTAKTLKTQFVDEAKTNSAFRFFTCDGTHMNPKGDIVLADTILRSFGLGKKDEYTALLSKWVHNNLEL